MTFAYTNKATCIPVYIVTLCQLLTQFVDFVLFCQLGFGKSMPSSTVWIDGVADNITDKWLIEYFSHYGKVNHCCVDKKKGRALIFYSEVEQAHYAVSDIKGSMISKKKIQVWKTEALVVWENVLFINQLLYHVV